MRDAALCGPALYPLDKLAARSGSMAADRKAVEIPGIACYVAPEQWVALEDARSRDGVSVEGGEPHRVDLDVTLHDYLRKRVRAIAGFLG